MLRDRNGTKEMKVQGDEALPGEFKGMSGNCIDTLLSDVLAQNVTELLIVVFW